MPRDIRQLKLILGTDQNRWPKTKLIEPPNTVQLFDASQVLLDALLVARSNPQRAAVLVRSINAEPMKRWFIDVAQFVGKWRFDHGFSGDLPTYKYQHVRQSPTRRKLLELFDRDNYHCRYCGARVIGDRKHFLALARIIEVPELVRTGTNEQRHGIYLTFRASHDHIIPHSAGGDNTFDNLATACWPCQFGKAHYTLEQIGLNKTLNPVIRDDGSWNAARRLLG